MHNLFSHNPADSMRNYRSSLSLIFYFLLNFSKIDSNFFLICGNLCESLRYVKKLIAKKNAISRFTFQILTLRL